MTLLIIIAVVSVFFAMYVTWLRPWLRNEPWAQPFFEAIEPIEMLWGKSETLLKARFKMVLGAILTTLAQIGAIDLSPLMPLVPEEYRGIVKFAFNMLPAILIIGGWIDEKLRRDTTLPLEVVAMPINAQPEVKAAVAEAKAASQIAAAVVVAETKAKKD